MVGFTNRVPDFALTLFAAASGKGVFSSKATDQRTVPKAFGKLVGMAEGLANWNTDMSFFTVINKKGPSWS